MGSTIVVDVSVKITFEVASEETKIETDVRADRLEEIFEEYLHAQMFTGSGTEVPENRDVYTITFGVELATDRWGTSDNCGNRGLSTGIVLRVFTLLRERSSKIRIFDYEGQEMSLP